MSAPEDVTERRLRLFHKGYPPVPITSPDTGYESAGKRPVLKGWQTVCESADVGTIADWARTQPACGNTGILCGKTVGADIDVLSEDVANEIETAARRILGGTPLKRVGRAPKRLLVYRTEAPFEKAQTADLFLGGVKAKVEVLATGQQFVAFGVHPETMRDYTWDTVSPLDVALADLPGVTAAQCAEFIQASTEILKQHGATEEKKHPKKRSHDRLSPINAAAKRRWDPLTRAALADVRTWAPELLPGGKWALNGDYRITSKALGRDLEEDLSISPKGIYDFGEERAMTPVEVVRKFCGAKTDEEAAGRLMELVGFDQGDPRTDVANGKRFAEQHGDDALYCYSWKSWQFFDGRRYAEDRDGELMRRAKMTAASIYAEAARAALVNPKEAEAMARHAAASQARARLEAMVVMAQSELPVKVEDLDADDMLLNLENGTLDLRTLTLRDHRREDRITKLAPVALDPDAICPNWQTFLNRIYGNDAELIAFVQRAVGYSLTAETSEQVLFLLHGTGANGKSTFIETLLALMGDYARPTEFRTLLNRENSEAVRNDLAALVGVRLVTAVEVARGRRLDEAMVKQITGGDTITARKLFKEFFDFKPKFKLWLAANVKPEIRGVDEGIWRRVLLIPHEVFIPPAERNRDLPAKLLVELPGILNWAIKGLRAWRADGLRPPAKVVDATAEYREEMDILHDFIETRCLRGDKLHVSTGTLYTAYAAWASENGEDPVEKKTFGKMLKERGFGDDVMIIANVKQRVKLGLALIDERQAAEPEADLLHPM